MHCCVKFSLLLILVAKCLYFQKLLDDMLSPLSNLIFVGFVLWLYMFIDVNVC